jgi:cytochrome c-type biogenesis protein
MESISVWVAFIAGLVSFFSPCCLPLYPSYLSFLTGIRYPELAGGHAQEIPEPAIRLRVFVHSLGFVIGLSMIFFSLGYGAGLLSDWFATNRDLIRQLAALVMVLMSLVLLGWIRLPARFNGLRMNWSKRPAGWFGSVVIGMGFAAGWSPCVGPILSSILALATVEPGTWFWLVSSYTLGFSIPFVALGWWVGSIRTINRWTPYLVRGGAVLLLLSGILLYTDQLMEWTIWYARVAPDWLKWG